MSVILSKSKLAESPALEAPKPQLQRNYTITCAGIVILLQTLVPGSLFIITGDTPRRKCVEIRIEAPDKGEGLQSMDVKASVQTLSVDGLPVVGGGEDAPVKVEEVLHESEGPITQTLASDSSDVEDIQVTAAEDPPEVANIPADALAVAISPPAAVASSESEPKVGFYPAGRSGLVLSPAFNMDHGIYPPGISAEQLEVFHETKRRRDAAKAIKPPPTYLYSELPGPPSRSSTEVTVKNSHRVPASNAEASGSRQPARAARRAITAGPSQNGSSSSSMPPPPTIAPPSPRKRGASEVADDSTAESGSSPPKRAKVAPQAPLRKTRRSKDSS